MNFSPQPESFLAGLVVGLVLLAIIWLITDRKALKAQLVALEAKAVPAVKVVEHDVHLVEASGKVTLAHVKQVFQEFFVDIQSEAAKIEAVNASLAIAASTVPPPPVLTTNAPATPPA